MILTTPNGILSKSQKLELKAQGYVVIECDDPTLIRIINPESEIETNDLLLAALSALVTKNPSYKQELFCNELYERLKSRSIKTNG